MSRRRCAVAGLAIAFSRALHKLRAHPAGGHAQGRKVVCDVGSPSSTGNGNEPRGSWARVLALPFVAVYRALSWVSRRFFVLRKPAPRWQMLLLGLLCTAACLALWYWATLGRAEERILGPTVLPSPKETFASFHSLWFDRALTRNVIATLRRVLLGFGLAVGVGVPLGVLCGCFARIQGFFAPIIIFGRNIPIAALIPLTFSLFGIGETQKVLFIFVACVAFIISDTAHAIGAIDDRYIDTAYTLGAKRRHIILKVLVPLAGPSIVSSLRVLFGLAFGYIMLAELVKFGGESGGLGDIIITSQRRGVREHILLVLLIIPLVAMAIDRLMFQAQKSLFPHKFGGLGILHAGLRGLAQLWEGVRSLLGLLHPLAEPAVPPDDGKTGKGGA
jgi:ABC-type nitrate/sulfonate/bicarbonate transport system permease component